MKSGVLALQGGVQEHVAHLGRVGVSPVLVRQPQHLSGLAGLILPGGESTCLRRLLAVCDIKEPLLAHVRDGMKLWGTCAGAILAATHIEGENPCLGIVDMSIRRNAYGSQLDSFRAEAEAPTVSPERIPLVFIRAPTILGIGENVQVLAKWKGAVVAVESESTLATTFHPELAESLAFHRHFVQKCQDAARQ